MLSIIIPVFNERPNVGLLHAELLSVLQSIKDPFEIIFIDDGSTDGTLHELKKLTPVRVISFSRNFGKSQALQAGFREAKGDYVFTMDGDMQDDPHEIPTFLMKMQEGDFDLVCGWKKNRLDSFAKRKVSKVANALTRFFTGTTVHDMNCGFKLYRKDLARTIDLYGDMHRYIPAIVASLGFRISEVPVNHRKREHGVSKYGNFRRLSKSFFDFVTLLLMRRFVDRPMHFFGSLGVLLSSVGGIVLMYLSYLKVVYGEAIGNRPLLLLGILLVVIGIQLFSSGFLGELLIRKGGGRTIYTIREDYQNI